MEFFSGAAVAAGGWTVVTLGGLEATGAADGAVVGAVDGAADGTATAAAGGVTAATGAVVAGAAVAGAVVEGAAEETAGVTLSSSDGLGMPLPLGFEFETTSDCGWRVLFVLGPPESEPASGLPLGLTINSSSALSLELPVVTGAEFAVDVIASVISVSVSG